MKGKSNMDMKPSIDDTRIALISNDISYMKSDIGDIKTSVKELAGVYATQVQFNDLAKEVTKLSDAIKEASNRQNGWQRFVPALVSSTLTGVIVFLIINFLQNAK